MLGALAHIAPRSGSPEPEVPAPGPRMTGTSGQVVPNNLRLSRATPTVIVVGGGDAGLAAALHLSTAGVRVRLVVEGGRAGYLPGVPDVILGRAGVDRFRVRLALPQLEVIAGRAQEVRPRGVLIGGHWVPADAVIAAPGLELARRPGDPAVGPLPCWDLPSAARVTARVSALERGVVAIVVASLPYRCPPAPFGLAMRLSQQFRRQQRGVRVLLTTPEARPLAALGPEPGSHLLAACTRAGVEVRLGWTPDREALERGWVVGEDGESLAADLVLLVPTHRVSSLLAPLAGAGPLIPVDDQFESRRPGLFVAGDAAGTPYPRASGAAIASGHAAAQGVLARLGLSEKGEGSPPELNCFVGHGDGIYSRLRVRYPGGSPPGGHPQVLIEGPSAELGTEFEAGFVRWRGARHPSIM